MYSIGFLFLKHIFCIHFHKKKTCAKLWIIHIFHFISMNFILLLYTSIFSPKHCFEGDPCASHRGTSPSPSTPRRKISSPSPRRSVSPAPSRPNRNHGKTRIAPKLESKRKVTLKVFSVL